MSGTATKERVEASERKAASGSPKQEGRTRKRSDSSGASLSPVEEGAAKPKQKKRGTMNKDLGRKGEDAAERYLAHRGYEILERNWTCFAGEADIIARDGHCLVFVEVKTRKNTDKGFPSEAVNAKKRERYERIALAYASEFPESNMQVRFDVVSIVVIAKDKAMIRHHLNAFTR